MLLRIFYLNLLVTCAYFSNNILIDINMYFSKQKSLIRPKQTLSVLCWILCCKGGILNIFAKSLQVGKYPSNKAFHKNCPVIKADSKSNKASHKICPVIKVDHKSFSCMCHRTDTNGEHFLISTFLMVNSDMFDVNFLFLQL